MHVVGRVVSFIGKIVGVKVPKKWWDWGKDHDDWAKRPLGPKMSTKARCNVINVTRNVFDEARAMP